MTGKRTYEPDWKGGRAPGEPKPERESRRDRRKKRKGRTVDTDAIARKLEADPVCRVTGRRASEGHHILLRSQGGDDVEDNILPLSRKPHRTYHDTGVLEGVTLTPEEVAYLVSKLGPEATVDYCKRKFKLEVKV